MITSFRQPLHDVSGLDLSDDARSVLDLSDDGRFSVAFDDLSHCWMEQRHLHLPKCLPEGTEGMLGASADNLEMRQLIE